MGESGGGASGQPPVERRALAGELRLQRALHAGEGVHVLDLRLRPEPALAAKPRAHVGVHAQASLLHADVADPRILEDLLEHAEVGTRLGRRAHVGLAHDLDERHAGAIEVDGGHAGIPVVDRLARVLLHVDARDAHLDLAALVGLADDEDAAGGERAIELRDLVPLGQVGVEVVLAREHRALVHGAAERQRGAHGELHGVQVEHGEGAGQRQTHRAGVLVGRGPEVGGAVAERLGARAELDVHLQPHDHLVAVGGGRGRGGRGAHRCASSPSAASRA